MEQSFIRKIKRRDRWARRVITTGGISVIFSVLLIMFLIVEVAVPLFRPARVELVAGFDLPQGTILAAGVDDYMENAYLLEQERGFLFFRLPEGAPQGEILPEPPGEGLVLKGAERNGSHRFSLLWSDGSMTLERVTFAPEFDGEGKRSIVYRLVRLAEFPPEEGGIPVRSVARFVEGAGSTRASLMPDGTVQVTRITVTEDFFGDVEEERSLFTLEDPEGSPLTTFALSSAGDALYAAAAGGALLRWNLASDDPELLERSRAFDDGREITALALVYGDISLAVGDEKGGVSTWFPVPGEEEEGKALRRIHTLASHRSAVVSITPSRRDKSLLSLDVEGILHFDHMTSERHLLTLPETGALHGADLSDRANSLVAMAEGRAVVWELDNPHPEVSFGTLFDKVWYESYDAPDYVWQSSAGTDDFEPKLSLTPLIFGTLKGTFYAMILAIPLALGGAIYTSQFCHPRFRQVIKPVVEIMAAIPSVVIGFLAALWFAPLVERGVVSFFLCFALLPLALFFALFLWQTVRRSETIRRIERGYEFLTIAPVLVLAVALAAVFGPSVEHLLFDGNFQLWLFSETGARYDQRNAIIISFALGFAVIPIIFTIAEDALSNVPPSLKAASLALGASRWQTVWRVILPSASPGIFAGIMIGLGRAIGETMIVLMATGNTAILDGSMFNGMRPLSSNIAVEIPEAPVFGTLYRVLFLSAVILFTMTFLLNTVAEVVRQRLREKYGRF